VAPAPALRRIVAGGAPMSDAQVDRWRRAFPDTHFVLLYGSSEAEPVAHLGAGARAGIHRRAGGPGHCVGRPVPEVEVRIRAEGPGAVGEVMVRGTHVSGAGWHAMGDAGYLDARGRLWLVGQAHARIRHRTGLVHAGAVEQAVQDAVAVPLQVAALAAPGGNGFAELVLVVHGPADESFRRSVRAAIARLALPVDHLVFRTRPLPTDPRHQSKVDRRALDRWLRRHQEVGP